MKIKIIMLVVIVSFIGSYFFFSDLYKEEPQSDLDARFDSIIEELDNYGGAMIVSYDTETGEITGKRSAKEAGVLSVTESEYEQVGHSIPRGSLVSTDDLSPRQAIEYINNQW